MKLQEKDIYLALLTREDCRKLWDDYEYDFGNEGGECNIGHSAEKAEGWFDEIQRLQGSQNVRLGVFLNGGAVIGDVALQNLDRANRTCSVGIGINRIARRGKGYGTQAVRLMLNYGFRYLGMERISADTLDMNLGMQRVLEKCGFVLEGHERRGVYLNGAMHDRLHYGILKEEFLALNYKPF